jgi:hypothetical protein
MQNNFHLMSLLIATLWATNPIAVGAQQKNSSGFEHVHSLAMNSGGQALFLGAHTGLYRSDDRGRTWNNNRKLIQNKEEILCLSRFF